MRPILALLLITAAWQYCFAEGVDEPVEITTQKNVENEFIFNQDEFMQRIEKMEQLYEQKDVVIDKISSNYTELLKNIANTENQITKLQRFMKVSKVFKPIVKFEKIGEKYYHIENKERLNWYEAVSRCRSMEANLISLQNEEEWKAITKQIRHYNKYWVDINDEATEGEYISESTGEKAPFLKWSVEEPNNSKGVENCVQMRESYGLFDETPHSMNDVECTSKTFFICEANEI